MEINSHSNVIAQSKAEAINTDNDNRVTLCGESFNNNWLKNRGATMKNLSQI